MSDTLSIVRDHAPVTLIGGGPVRSDDLDVAMIIAPEVICADAGLIKALERGIMPSAVIGDLDSVDADLLAGFEGRVIKVADQDTTDFDKSLMALDVPLVLGVGFLGGRLDHELAVLSGLAKRPDLPVILIGEEDVCFLCPDQLALQLPVGTRFSIYPLTSFQATSEGLKWELDALTLHPTGLLGTSNETTAEQVSVSRTDGVGICILPKEHMLAVVGALTGRNVNGQTAQ